MAAKTGLDSQRMYDELTADAHPDDHIVHARLAMYDHFDDVGRFETAVKAAKAYLERKDASAELVGKSVAKKLTE
jgi:hypothetical protein